jgi:hypothetical protein
MEQEPAWPAALTLTSVYLRSDQEGEDRSGTRIALTEIHIDRVRINSVLAHKGIIVMVCHINISIGRM